MHWLSESAIHLSLKTKELLKCRSDSTSKSLVTKMMGALDINRSQLSPLSGVAVPARQATKEETVPAYVDWLAGTASPLSGLS